MSAEAGGVARAALIEVGTAYVLLARVGAGGRCALTGAGVAYCWTNDFSSPHIPEVVRGDFRRFRAERILEARLLAGDFRPQVLFKPIKDPKELLSANGTVPAQVAFSKKIARWLKEKYPSGREERDGRYVVTFQVADPAWLVREVLQYGAEAEVLGPEGLREAVRRMVSTL